MREGIKPDRINNRSQNADDQSWNAFGGNEAVTRFV